MMLGSLWFQEERVRATMLNSSISSSSRFKAVRHGGEAAKPPILPRSADISKIWIHLTAQMFG
jgi:hypothetical protein